MLTWRKLAGEKWLDSWQERLAFLGRERLVITQLAGSHRIRLEIFDITAKESRLLVKQFGGEVRDLSRSTADWVKSVVLKKPISIRGRLFIQNDEPKAGSPLEPRTIHIPASLAFGTGDHATTAGCLRLLVDIAPRNGLWTFLDAGTGTGILAIAAKKLGAERVVAFDFDPVAVRLAKTNVRINRVTGISFEVADVLQFRSPTRFDIVAANLYAELFRNGARRIWSALKPSGSLILSGILSDQVNMVEEILHDLRGTIQSRRRRGKWLTIHAKKKERGTRR
jgi:ribosomal protein L11 methyltransferase